MSRFQMMRLRVLAQGGTLAALVAGAMLEARKSQLENRMRAEERQAATAAAAAAAATASASFK